MEAWNVLCDGLFLIGSYIHMIKLLNSYLKGFLRYSNIHLNVIEHKKYAQLRDRLQISLVIFSEFKGIN